MLSCARRLDVRDKASNGTYQRYIVSLIYMESIDSVSATLGKLEGSFYGTEDHIQQISNRFDETTKKTFRSATDVCLVPFGSTTDRDLEHGIRSGKLKLAGYVFVT